MVELSDEQAAEMIDQTWEAEYVRGGAVVTSIVRISSAFSLGRDVRFGVRVVANGRAHVLCRDNLIRRVDAQ